MNGARPRRSRATTATRRGSRSPRSPGGSVAQKPPSRRTCTTNLTLTKGLRKPRRDARRVWRPPAHKADPGLSRAERTPPWPGGTALRPIPSGARAHARGRYLSAYASRRSAGGSRRLVGAHNSAIAGGHGHAVGTTIATVAKRKPASTVSGEQSDRQLSGCGSSGGTGCDVSCGWDGVVVVAGFVDVVVFLGEVVAPVLLEVAVGFDGA